MDYKIKDYEVAHERVTLWSRRSYVKKVSIAWIPSFWDRLFGWCDTRQRGEYVYIYEPNRNFWSIEKSSKKRNFVPPEEFFKELTIKILKSN